MNKIKKMSKKRKNINDDDDDDGGDYFKIEDYTIINLESLISMIFDLDSKLEPPKKIKNKLPVNIYKLINILDPLIKLNNLIGMKKLKKQ